MFFNISNANIYHSVCQCIMSDFTAMECFAPMFFKLQSLFDAFGCSPESFHSENVLIDFRFLE